MSDIPVLLWILIVLLCGLMFLSLCLGTIGFLIWDLFRRIREDNKKGP